MLTVPLERQVWSAEQCAAYLGQEKATFLKGTQYATGFPKRCPIPGQPRWPAFEVTKWALGETTEQITNGAVSS